MAQLSFTARFYCSTKTSIKQRDGMTFNSITDLFEYAKRDMYLVSDEAWEMTQDGHRPYPMNYIKTYADGRRKQKTAQGWKWLPRETPRFSNDLKENRAYFLQKTKNAKKSKEQKEAMLVWADDTWNSAISELLRKGKTENPEMEASVKQYEQQLEKVIEKEKLGKDVTVYRQVKNHHIDDLLSLPKGTLNKVPKEKRNEYLKGLISNNKIKPYTEESYMATSLNKDINYGNRKNGGVTIEIQAPKEAHGMYIEPHSGRTPNYNLDELLLLKTQTLRYTDVNYDPSTDSYTLRAALEV